MRTRYFTVFLVVLALVALAQQGYCGEFAQVDVGLAKKSAAALAITEKGLPAIATVVLIFYLFQSLTFRILSDLSLHKWAGLVVLNIAFLAVFFGGSINSVFGIKRANPSQITRVTTDTYPGDGATESSTPTGAATNFEILANAFNGDEESLAADASGNYAMVQTINGTEHTRWALDMSSVADSSVTTNPGALGFRFLKDIFATSSVESDSGSTSANSDKPQKDLYNSIAAINSSETETGLLGGCLLYLNNAVSSVAGSIGANYDAKQMARAAQGAEAQSTSGDTQAWNSSDVFADSNLNIASANSKPVTVVTMATYPGGVQEYGRHALDYIANPDKNYMYSTIPGAQVTAAISSSNQQSGSLQLANVVLPSPTASGTGTVYDYAKQAGFDGEKEGVYPQYFLRTHAELQSSECNGNATAQGLRPGSSGDTALTALGSSILNPSANIPSLPLQANTAQLQQATSIFGNLNSFGTGNGGVLLSSLLSQLTSLNGEFDKLNSYAPQWTQSNTQSSSDPIQNALTQYDQLIADTSKNGMSHATSCLENGKSMLQVVSAINKASGANDTAYHNWLEGKQTGAMAEAESTLAYRIGNRDADPELFARNVDSNEASISDIVNHVVGYVSAIGQPSGTGSMNTKVPTTQETSWTRPDQKLQQAADANDKSGDAKMQKAKNSDSWMDKISNTASAVTDFIAATLQNFLQFMLRLAAILFAGLPFLVLLTQVAVATHVAHFSYAIGMAILPIYAVMNTGKLFSQQSAGDDHFQGISFFPIVTIIVTMAVLGAEVAAAKVCQGEVNYYLTHIVDLLAAQIEASLRAVGMILTNGLSGNSFNFKTILNPMLEATRPFGVCAAAVIAPMLIGRIMTPGIIAPHASASMIQGMAGSASQGGAGHIAGVVKTATTAVATGGTSLAAEGAAKSGDPGKR